MTRTAAHLPVRHGVTVPLPGPLHGHRDRLVELADLGYTDCWSAEASRYDGLTPLAMIAAWEPRLRVGTAILSAFTRGPGLMAQSVAAMADAAPGRFAVGIGSSSNIVVERWNGIPFEEPYRRVSDMVRFLRDSLGGERVDARYDSFEISGFRLSAPPEQVPPILVAALRPGMLRLAGHLGDGAIINWLGADDVPKVVAEVDEGAGGEPREVVCRIFVCPSEDTAVVRAGARRMITAYLNVPVYRAFHQWLGRGEQLREMWTAWDADDREAAMAAVPDEVVDALVVHGSPATCRGHIARYFANGVTTSSLSICHFDPALDVWQATKALSPGAMAS